MTPRKVRSNLGSVARHQTHEESASSPTRSCTIAPRLGRTYACETCKPVAKHERPDSAAVDAGRTVTVRRASRAAAAVIAPCWRMSRFHSVHRGHPSPLPGGSRVASRSNADSQSSWYSCQWASRAASPRPGPWPRPLLVNGTPALVATACCSAVNTTPIGRRAADRAVRQNKAFNLKKFGQRSLLFRGR